MAGSGGGDRGDDEDEPENILSSSILQTMTGYRIQKYATLPSLRTVRRFAVKRTRTGIQKFSLEPMMQM